MKVIYNNLLAYMWGTWALYWWLAARNTKRAIRKESLSSRLAYLIPLVLAALLLWRSTFPWLYLDKRFLPASPSVFWIGSVITACGLLFCVWARVYLGKNWSGTVTIKEGHELISSGPYALVRHPIYSGLLIALCGSAVARGEWRGVLAVGLAACSLWFKLQREEKWLSEQFGESYAAYCQRVAALVPFML